MNEWNKSVTNKKEISQNAEIKSVDQTKTEHLFSGGKYEMINKSKISKKHFLLPSFDASIGLNQLEGWPCYC
jgi:hypothetical protein